MVEKHRSKTKQEYKETRREEIKTAHIREMSRDIRSLKRKNYDLNERLEENEIDIAALLLSMNNLSKAMMTLVE